MKLFGNTAANKINLLNGVACEMFIIECCSSYLRNSALVKITFQNSIVS